MDGRGCEDYRHMEIETDVVSNTDGSAKVTLVTITCSKTLRLYFVICTSVPLPLSLLAHFK